MSEKLKTVEGGLLIFFDGIDGVGKTTQLEAAQAHLQNDGWLVKASRIHGGTPIGEELRKVSLSHIPRPVETDFYLHMALHAAHHEQLAGWRQLGAIALIDRSPLAYIGYQVYGDGLEASLGWDGANRSMASFAPELTIIYTADVPVALERASRKPGWDDYFGSKPPDYFERVQAGYIEAAQRFGATVIDANQSFVEVEAQTWSAISRIMPTLN